MNGTCPNCDSTDIDYGDIEFNTDYVYPFVYQDCVCNNCGCEFKEKWQCDYVDSEITNLPSN